MYRDYAPRGVKFYYVYKTVAHPLINNFVSAYSLAERQLHIQEAIRRTHSKIPWICDGMDNSIKRALGGAPNGEFVIDPDGKIVRKRFWSNPETLRADLTELVGPVENPTSVDDLDVVFRVEPRKIISGIVPRVKVDTSALAPVKVKPNLGDVDETPYYVKLRAEADRSLLRTGKGQLYLGCFLDPIYKVHWNNAAGRVQVRIEDADGIKVSRQQLEGPQVEAPADVDPREFLVDVELEGENKTLKISVDYMACDDAETFCVPVTQQYEVTLTRDGDGGSRPGVFMPPMFANTADFDKNQDGQIDESELPPGRATLYLGHIDFNHNGVIEKEELEAFLKMFNNGRGFTKPETEEANQELTPDKQPNRDKSRK